MIKKLLFSFLANIKQKKLDLIDEQKSPLFRAMAIFNDNDPTRRKFENNICAFHIGNGFILSVAHNLRIKSPIPQSMPESIYQNQIIQNLPQADQTLFNNKFSYDAITNKRYLGTVNDTEIKQLQEKLDTIRFDRRYVSMYASSICKPFLIIQFRNDAFYNDPTITQQLNNKKFYEAPLFRYTFILELELVRSFYNEDIALYKLINIDQNVINKIPSTKIDFNIYDKSAANLFCLQSAPFDNLGRLLNEAKIEGLLDHWGKFADDFQGDYIFEGMRYLIKGYFRFGSSGAPYLIYNSKKRAFRVNAIQSEASPIQISINGKMNGNWQYVNAIATPLKNIEQELKALIN